MLRCGDTPSDRTGQPPIAKSTGQPCRQPVIPGTTRCRWHGGKQQAADPHANERGGAPVLHGFYAKRLPPEALAELEDVPPFGTLEYELVLARWMLKEAIGRYGDTPTGGLVKKTTRTGAVQSVDLELHQQVVGDWIDRVARLERAEQALRADDDPGDDSADALEDYQTWLESVTGPQ